MFISNIRNVCALLGVLFAMLIFYRVISLLLMRNREAGSKPRQPAGLAGMYAVAFMIYAASFGLTSVSTTDAIIAPLLV